MKVLIEIPEEWSDKTDVPTAEEWEEIVMSGQPLPDDCEILTKEAYSDLCVRASKGNCSEIPTGSEKLSSELEKNSKKPEKAATKRLLRWQREQREWDKDNDNA